MARVFEKGRIIGTRTKAGETFHVVSQGAGRPAKLVPVAQSIREKAAEEFNESQRILRQEGAIETAKNKLLDEKETIEKKIEKVSQPLPRTTNRQQLIRESRKKNKDIAAVQSDIKVFNEKTKKINENVKDINKRVGKLRTDVNKTRVLAQRVAVSSPAAPPAVEIEIPSIKPTKTPDIRATVLPEEVGFQRRVTVVGPPGKQRIKAEFVPIGVERAVAKEAELIAQALFGTSLLVGGAGAAAGGITTLARFATQIGGGLIGAEVIPEVAEPTLRAIAAPGRTEADIRFAKAALSIPGFIVGAKAAGFTFDIGKGVAKFLALPKTEVLRRGILPGPDITTIPLKEIKPGVFGIRPSPKPGVFRFDAGRIVKVPPTKPILPIKFVPSPRPGIFIFERGKVVPIPKIFKPTLPEKFVPSPMPGFFRFEVGRIIEAPKPKKPVLPEKFMPSPRPGFFVIRDGKLVRVPLKIKPVLPEKFVPSPKPGIFRIEKGKIVLVTKLKPPKEVRPFFPEDFAKDIEQEAKIAFKDFAKPVIVTKPIRPIEIGRFDIPASFRQLARGLPRLPAETRRQRVLRQAMFAEFARPISIFEAPAKRTPLEKELARSIAGGIRFGEFLGLGISPALAQAIGLKPGETIRQAQRRIELRRQKEIEREQERLEVQFGEIPTFGISFREEIRVLERTAEREREILREFSKQIPIQRISFKELEKQITKELPKDLFRPFPIIPRLKKKRKAIIAVVGKPQGFHAFLKVRGDFRRVSKKPLHKSTALALGAFLADFSSARTFKIKPTTMRARGAKKRSTILKKKFRKPIRKGVEIPAPNLFIEKTPFLIDKPGERREITQAGLAALRQRFFKPKKKRRFKKMPKKRKTKKKKKGNRR